MKPFKPQAYAALMKRDPKQWAHWAQPLEVVCMDQVTSNGAESTMNSIGHAVRRYAGPFFFFISLHRCSGGKTLSGRIITTLAMFERCLGFASRQTWWPSYITQEYERYWMTETERFVAVACLCAFWAEDDWPSKPPTGTYRSVFGLLLLIPPAERSCGGALSR